MANNRLYVVNKNTREYSCIGKSFDYSWEFGNSDILKLLLNNTFADKDKCDLIIGCENDDKFFKKWIENGINLNKTNKWEI